MLWPRYISLCLLLGCGSSDMAGTPNTCGSSLDCSPTQECFLGECVAGAGLSCTETAPCPAGQTCQEGQCQGGGGARIGPGSDAWRGDSTPGQDGESPLPSSCHSNGDCDDSNPCSEDRCVAGLCVHPILAAPSCSCVVAQDCEDQNPCSVDTCAAGLCSYGAAAVPGCCTTHDECNDADPAMETQCVAFQCVGSHCMAAADCDDQDLCTSDACVSGTCTHTLVPNCCLSDAACNNGDPCTLGACEAGTCIQHASGQPGCCQSDADCDDNFSCTVDTCLNGACQNTPITGCCTNATQCADNNSCTSDSCYEGQCQNETIQNCCQSAQDCNDDDFCTTDSCSGGTCVYSPTPECCLQNPDCNDGLPCTTDQCLNGNCLHTPELGCCNDAADCDDNNPCTTESCAEQTCSSVPVSSPACSGGNPACVPDDYEENEVAPGAMLGSIEDCDGLSDPQGATLDSPSDVDWYRYNVDDTFGCDVEPQVVITGTVPGTSFSACLYFTCANGANANISCLASDSVLDESLGNKTHGCCVDVVGTESKTLRVGPSCSTFGLGDESGAALFKMNPLSGVACLEYSFQWGDS